MKVTISIQTNDEAAKSVVVAKIKRKGPYTAATLELTLAESKQLLCELQQQVVQSQIAIYESEQRLCSSCNARRRIKDRRSVRFKSLFGAVQLRVPRLFGCRCDGQSATARPLTLPGMANWVAPQLEYVQSHLAATIPYARSSQLLQMPPPHCSGDVFTRFCWF